MPKEIPLKEILVQGGYLSQKDADRAQAEADKKKLGLQDYLLAEDILSADLIGQGIAEYLGVGYADLHHQPPSPELILRIPEEIAIKYRAVLMRSETNIVTVASSDPNNRDLPAELDKLFPMKGNQVLFEFPEKIDELLTYYRKPLGARFIKIIEENKRVAPEIVEQVFEDAITSRASDVHFDPREESVVVRFRVDGVLQEVGRIPKEHYENILNLIKVRSHLRIDEHLSTQDGSIHYLRNGDGVDLRIAISPTVGGERLAIRILSKYVRDLSFRELGLSESGQKSFNEAIQKPFGMILAVGPTGSGKTTTIYALLKMLNRPEVNIITIEDPVEYRIPEINQIQVNPQTNLTFAAGLRSIIRQDPNIIFVGEIRDRETAEISVNAALTGHLLLSTFHANNAATAIPRLLEMGIEPFLLSSTLEILIAQRLVRVICSNCRRTVTTNRKEISEKLPPGFSSKVNALYSGKGCPVCSGTGYLGRTAIFEVIKLTPALRELILKSPSATQIWDLAIKEGSRSMFEDGLEKVGAGVTTLEELLRVAPPQ